jgi:hypothetical protein
MEETTLHSEGQCTYCKETFTQKDMSKHLAAHLKKMSAEKPSRDKSFHIRVEAGPYFLNLLIDSAAPLSFLDDYLRAIWLECCGHMSTLVDKSKKYEFNFDNNTFGEDMSQGVSQLFKKGQKLKYKYDMGSTTTLEIKVLDEYNVLAREGTQLLSRNEPLKILCHVCNEKPAFKMCTVHEWNEPSLFCKPCSTTHKKECPDFADYAAMPISNSPRMGVCGYESGQIDKKRDGAWKEKSV